MINQTGGLSFDQGNAKCKELGAQLASIHSADENAFVARQLFKIRKSNIKNATKKAQKIVRKKKIDIFRGFKHGL